MSTINIAIADDQQVVRDDLEKMLKNIKGINVLFVAQNGKEVVNFIEKQGNIPDVIIMDIDMPEMNGFLATKEISKFYPNTRILFLTGFVEPSFIETALNSGGHGYISKYDEVENIVQAIREVCEVGFYFNDLVSFNVIKHHFQKAEPDFNYKTLQVINSREIHIIRLICNEESDEDIARQLNISLEELKTKIDHIMQKVGIRSKIGLTVYGFRNGIYVP